MPAPRADASRRLQGSFQAAAVVLALAVLALLFWWTVEPGGNGTLSSYRVASVSAQGEVQPGASLVVTFDRPLVSEAAASRGGSAAGLLTLRPEAPVNVTWASPSRLVLRPLAPLAMATRFELLLAERIDTLAGVQLNGPRTYAFHTPPLKLVDTTQTAYSSDLRATVRLRFNMPVAPADLRSYARLAGAGAAPVAYELISEGPGRELEVRTSAPVTGLWVEIGHGLRGQAGPLGLVDDVRVPVLLTRRLSLVMIEAESVFRGWPDVSLFFNQDVKSPAAGKLEDYLSIDPPLELYASIGGRRSQVVLSGKFEPGRSYRVTLRKGLSGANDTALVEEVSRDVRIPDREPDLAFRDEASILSPQGSARVVLVAANLGEVEVRAARLPENNLVHYLSHGSRYGGSAEHFLRRGPSSRLVLDAPRNQVVERSVDLRELLGGDPKGIWLLEVRAADDVRATDGSSASDSLLVALADLGLTAKRSTAGIVTWVTSLSSGAPVARARVSLWSRSSQKLAEEFTDSDGLVTLDAVAGDPDGEAYVVTAERGGELSYLEVDRRRLAQVDFDVRGRAHVREGYEAFVFGGRGVYRPGDTVDIAAIVRDRWNGAPASFPVDVEVLRPDRKRAAVIPSVLGEHASVSAVWTIPAAARTGKYEALLRLPGEGEVLGSTSFLVEDFMPKRLTASLRWAAGDAAGDEGARRLRPGDEIAAVAGGQYLAGLPASGAVTELRWVLSPETLRIPGLDEFRFGGVDERVAELSGSAGSKDLDAGGEARFTVEVPRVKASQPFRLEVTAEVFDASGRPESARLEVSVDPCPRYLGLRVASPRELSVGETVVVECADVTPDGTPAAAGEVELRAVRVEWSSVFRKTSTGDFHYESVRELREIARERVKLDAGRAQARFTFPRAGTYEILAEEVLAPEERAASARMELWLSESVAMQASASAASYSRRRVRPSAGGGDKPEHLTLLPLPGLLRPGGKARVLVSSPFPGTLLVTTETDRVLSTRVVRNAGLETEVEVDVPTDASGNFYAGATLVRPTLAAAGESAWGPVRAYGYTPLWIDRAPEELTVTLDAPSILLPRARASVRARITDSRGEPCAAEVALAIVDEGILGRTQHRTPDPWGFFYGKRALEVETADLFGLVLPEVPLSFERARAGGDKDSADEGGGDLDARLLSPVQVRRVKPVALWLGLRPTDAGGEAIVDFELPPFSGRLRVIAVAHSGRRFGSGERGVIVRAPVHIELGMPRFAAPGDRFVSRIELVNTTSSPLVAALDWALGGPVVLGAAPSGVLVDAALAGAAARVTPEVSADPEAVRAVWRQDRVELSPGAPQRVRFELACRAEPGAARAVLRAGVVGAGAADGGDDAPALVEEAVDFAVRPAAPLRGRSRSGTLAHGEVLDVVLGGDDFPGTARQRIVLTPRPGIELLGALRYLVDYPHGCVEQTTSRAFPLLYLRDLARLLGSGYGRGAADAALGERELWVDDFIDAGISRLLSMQGPRGGLGGWASTDKPWVWGTLYATHFLLEARKAGHDVDSGAAEGLLAYVESDVVRSPLHSISPTERAYGVFVLALAGRRADAVGFAQAILERSEQLEAAVQSGGSKAAPGAMAGELLPAEARFFLGAAFLAAGQGQEARRVLGEELPPPSTRERDLGGELRSPAREAAILLSVLLDVEPLSPWTAVLADRLRGFRTGGWWGTTQENAFALLALGKYARQAAASPANYTAVVRLGDGEPLRLTATDSWTEDGDFTGKRLRVEVEGDGRLYWHIHEEGVPKSGVVDEADQGLAVRRRFLDREGKPIAGRDLKQGELVQVEISLKSSRVLANLLVTDLIPAGLEVENPRLGGVAVARSPAATGFFVDHLDVRDDRVLLYGSLHADGGYRYAARAVTAGDFSLPAVAAECLYDPGIFSRNGAGRIKIVEAE